jgi:phosphoribosylaminoimidazole synthetase
MYAHGEYDLAGFCIGAVPKSKLLPQPVHSGDIVFGLRSSGVHSNGYSLVRKLVDVSGLAYDAPCPFDHDADEGKNNHHRSSSTLGQRLLTPTRIYVRLVLPLIQQGLIRALAHITGGGLVENIPRVLSKNDAVEIDCANWTMPPVFQWLKSIGHLSDAELSRTFNCGIGMVLIVAPEHADRVCELLASEQEDVIRMGKVVPRPKETGEAVTLVGPLH